jgi:phosphate transport system protein
MKDSKEFGEGHLTHAEWAFKWKIEMKSSNVNFHAVIEMVRSALDSFLEGDVDLARKVIEKDSEVDQFNVDLIDELQQLMRDDSELVEAAVHCFSASRHLERIADMATHVAEETVYLVSGEIIRHGHGNEFSI